MNFEPPLKRRRRDQMPTEEEEEEGEEEEEEEEDEEGGEDEELIFQQFGLDVKRDSGYKLSIERAYSDHRFQATMAHIFEKYGRDFDGIGDEIDLATGEIVVNNGHLHNMRNEGDVGDHVGRDKSADEDDEGILWEDLTDGENDDKNDEDNSGNESVEGDGEMEPNPKSDDGEDGIAVNSSRSAHQSMALVARHGPEALAGRWEDSPSGMMPSMPWSNSFEAGPFAFGPPSLAYGPPPFSLGPPPFCEGPWDIPGPFPGPYWSYQSAQAQTQRSALEGHRYKFKPQQGRSSIWARRSRYKEAEDEPLRSVFNMALGKHLAQAKSKTRKRLPAPIDSKPSEDDDDDEEAILSGKPRLKTRVSLDNNNNSNHNDEKYDEQEFLALGRATRRRKSMSQNQEVETVKQGRERGEEEGAQMPKRGRKRKRRATNGGAAEVEDCGDVPVGSYPGSPSRLNSRLDAIPADHSRDTGHGNRRRSSRACKRVDSLNQTSAETPPETRCQRMRIDLPPLDPHTRDEYQTWLILDEPGLSPSDHDAEQAQGRNGTPGPLLEQDSPASEPDHNVQDLPECDSDQAPSSSSLAEKDDVSQDGLSNPDPTCVLSDDEAPIVRRAEAARDLGQATVLRRHSARINALPVGHVETPVEPEAMDEDEAEAALIQQELNPPSVPAAPHATDRIEPPACSSDAAPSSPTLFSSTGKPSRLRREVRWLRKDVAAAAAASPTHSPRETASPTAPRRRLRKPTETSMSSPHSTPSANPKTPRHQQQATQTPSSRRSILSLLPDTEDCAEMDELGRSLAAMPGLLSSGVRSTTAKRFWRSKALTTEAYHTPVKKRPNDPVSPGSLIRTPGGSMRACGLDGFRCGRDFCFACL